MQQGTYNDYEGLVLSNSLQLESNSEFKDVATVLVPLYPPNSVCRLFILIFFNIVAWV